MRWRRRLGWDPGRGTWRVAVLFMVGSLLFAIGSFPVYGMLVSASTVGLTFFVGSIAFTMAAAGQFAEAVADRRRVGPESGGGGSGGATGLAVWAGVVQLLGTLLFNLSTGDALRDNLDVAEVNRLVWAPDVYGSVAFLVASALAWTAVCGPRWCRRPDDPDWWMAALNALGSVFFMVSAVAALTLPTTGQALNLALVNSATVAGALCFLVGAWLLLPDDDRAART
ncbi:hypothetical protein [Salsipaludibacter albus]|uniref:hypothetical protein n=1 Tax=Salsipaludibacter albus TaxID=2849650 RepID=UPI001EE43DF9|nr:hypothetical protein [Salsipaludibacter albus]MBY5161328.1 hypothetical protein [Salsipaludibacter albus]